VSMTTGYDLAPSGPRRRGRSRRGRALRVARPTTAAEHGGGYRPGAHPGFAGDSPEGVLCGGVEPAGVLAALEGDVEVMSQVDLDAVDDRGLLELAVALDRTVARLQAQTLRVLREVDTRGAYVEDGCVTAGSWWRMRTRRDATHASVEVHTARRLGFLDQVRAAFEAGEIRQDHATRIARAARGHRREAVEAHEHTLVDLARTAPPADVGRACQRIADMVDPDGTGVTGVDGGGTDVRRQVRCVRTVDGLGDLQATLDPVTADRLDALLAALDGPPATDDPRSAGQRRHDAFDALLRAAEQHPDLPTVHGAKPHVLLTIDLMTLLGNQALASRSTRTRSGTELPLERALELLDEAKLTAVLMCGPFRPVGVGRTFRTLPAWLRPLKELIHGHCRGPGCDRPIAWTDAAHLNDWAKGGLTDLLDTLPACPGHHELMDKAGWNVTYDPDTAICQWTSPDGQTTILTHPPDP
jgi:hypothetical protein